MPYRKSPPSLQNLCLNSIIANFGQLQDQLTNQPSTFIHNIYQRISQSNQPSTFIPNIHQLFSQSNHTEPRLDANIFVQPKAKQLHNLHLFDLPMIHLLDSIGQVCKNLKELDLGRSNQEIDSQITLASVTKLLQHLPQLQRLHFARKAYCTDQFVAAIGRHCPLLQHLDLTNCSNVTDAGVSLLSGCTKLQDLDICGTSVTPNGCLHILDQLPLLKRFRIDFWRELFPMLKQRFSSSETVGRNYLINETGLCLTTSEDIIILAAIFPNLINLSIMTINFNPNILMQRLNSLFLIDVPLVKVTLIDRCCPVLKELKLHGCSLGDEPGDTVCSNESVNRIPFERLRLLSVNCGNVIITELQMKMLLQQCRNVEDLEFATCEAVTENLIAELVKSNLPRLKELRFILCPFVTLSSLRLLSEMDNPLRSLNCYYCPNINALAIREIREFVRNNNLDLQTEYFGFDA